MDKLEVILLDQDLDYARSLRDYFRTLSGGEAITLKQFTKLKTAEAAIKHAGAGTVLLVAEAEWPLGITVDQPVFVLLEESEQALDEQPAQGQPWLIYKYQPLEQFMVKIRKLAANQSSSTQSDPIRVDGRPALSAGTQRPAALERQRLHSI